MGYNPSYKWINPTYPIYNWGYKPLTKWDEPPSNDVMGISWDIMGMYSSKYNLQISSAGLKMGNHTTIEMGKMTITTGLATPVTLASHRQV